MPKAPRKSVEAARRAKLRALAGTLPQVQISGDQHLMFRVGKKTLAWYLNNHHDDGVIGLCAKSTRARQQALVAANPERYYVPPYVGPQGWVGLRLDLATVEWNEVLELLVAAYRMQALRRLAREFE